jgi:hypothetical protein
LAQSACATKETKLIDSGTTNLILEKTSYLSRAQIVEEWCEELSAINLKRDDCNTVLKTATIQKGNKLETSVKRRNPTMEDQESCL